MDAGVSAPVFVQLKPHGASGDLLVQGLRQAGVALAQEAEVHREGFQALQHARHMPGAGVQVVALVPVAGPVPPPIIVVTPLISASSICCGQIKWMWASMAPAVSICPSPAMISVPGPMLMVTSG